MMTVSDSMPSYWFVWYIHTPHCSDRESWLEPMVLACPGLRSIWYTGGRAGLYCHKPAQESKSDLYPSGSENIGALHATSAAHHARRRARSRNAAEAPISARRARYSAVQRPVRSRMTSGGRSVRAPSQAHVKSPIRGGR